jgi:toxin-antitoxin system PIN domain toxin
VIVPDVNVLVHLHRREHRHHDVVHQWWLDYLEKGEPLTVPDLIWVGFIRIVTNRRIFDHPSSLDEAWQFVAAVRAQGIYIEYAAHPHLLELFEGQLRTSKASADLVTDAYIASAAMALGASVVTFDRDFRRFDGLSMRELG